MKICFFFLHWSWSGKFASFFFGLSTIWNERLCRCTISHWFLFFIFFFAILFKKIVDVLCLLWNVSLREFRNFSGDSGREKKVRVICLRVLWVFLSLANTIFLFLFLLLWLVMRCKCDKIRSNVDENDERWTLHKTS